MSTRVKQRLDAIKIEATSAERQEIDKEIESQTKLWCDKGIDKIDDKELREIVDLVRRRKKTKVMEMYA